MHKKVAQDREDALSVNTVIAHLKENAAEQNRNFDVEDNASIALIALLLVTLIDDRAEPKSLL